jgi:hypothetical protein
MEVRCLGFIPPVVGVEKDFNTFRLGSTLYKALEPGMNVYLLDTKKLIVFGSAVVRRIYNGPLWEMCLDHGANNHTELGKDDIDFQESMFKTMQKMFGPQIALPTKNCTVIYLSRLE